MFFRKTLAFSFESRLLRKKLFVYALLLPFLFTGCAGRKIKERKNLSYASRSYGTAGGIQEQARAYDRAPGQKNASLYYANSLKNRGRLSEALAVLRKASLRNKADSDIAAAYGKVLASSGHFPEAAKVLANAHTPDRPDWRLLSAQGAVEDQMGRHQQARQLYKNALLLSPNEPTILSNLGLSYALTEELEKAETILSQAAASPNADARVKANLELVRNLRKNLSPEKNKESLKEKTARNVSEYAF